MHLIHSVSECLLFSGTCAGTRDVRVEGQPNIYPPGWHETTDMRKCRVWSGTDPISKSREDQDELVSWLLELKAEELTKYLQGPTC